MERLSEDELMTNIRRKFEERLSQKQDTLFAMPGVMGDFSGQVDAGTPGMVYVQVAQTVETALCLAVPRVAGLLVWVGYTPHQPNVLQVLGQRVGYGTSATQPQPGVAAHAASHEYLGEGPLGGTDVVKVKLQQFMPLRVFPAGGLTVGIYPGIVRSASSYVIVADTNSFGMPIPKTIDLWMDLPAAGKSRYVLISIDVNGAVIATLGAEVTTALLAITDIPAPPADTQYVLAAVRLWDGQQTIVENRDNPDIVDLRYPIMHYHQAGELVGLQLDNLGDVTITAPADGEVIFYDLATAKWTNGTLAEADIAAASDLSSHTGNTANPHNVTKAQIGLGNVANTLHKRDATAAPTVNDDASIGYSIGSEWTVVTTDQTYQCQDATIGAAVWKDITGLVSPMTAVGDMIMQGTSVTLNNTDQSGNKVISASPSNVERIIASCDLQIPNPVGTVSYSVNLWVSMNDVGKTKTVTVNLHRDNVNGAALVQDTKTMTIDSSLGHDQQIVIDGVDSSPTTGRYVLTISSIGQSIAAIYSDTRQFSISGISNVPARFPIGTEGQVHVVTSGVHAWKNASATPGANTIPIADANGLLTPWVIPGDAPLNNYGSVGDHFLTAGSYPTGWTEVDAPASTVVNSLKSYWSLVTSTSNLAWKYSKRFGLNFESYFT